MAKLTKPQMEFLGVLAMTDRAVSLSYKPARKLVELKLATVRDGRYGGTILSITDAGRDALAEKDQTK